MILMVISQSIKEQMNIQDFIFIELSLVMAILGLLGGVRCLFRRSKLNRTAPPVDLFTRELSHNGEGFVIEH